MQPPRLWIDVVRDAEVTGRLRELYDRIRDPAGRIDDIMLAHGLRPHTMEGQPGLYKAVLHHARNALPRWLLEANQVVANFAYANRTVLGLGVTTEGDVLGLSPSAADDPNDWRHR